MTWFDKKLSIMPTSIRRICWGLCHMGVGEEGGPLGLGNHERSAGQFFFFFAGLLDGERWRDKHTIKSSSSLNELAPFITIWSIWTAKIKAPYEQGRSQKLTKRGHLKNVEFFLWEMELMFTNVEKISYKIPNFVTLFPNFVPMLITSLCFLKILLSV